RKGISRSGLSTVLDELKKKDFPDATSRQTIKRRRDADVDVQTRYGKLLQDWKVTLLPVGKTKKKSGSVTKPKEMKTVEFPFVQPIPLLCHMFILWELRKHGELEALKAECASYFRLVGDAGDQCLGEVNFFATAMGKNFCCVTQWNALGSNKFQKSAESLVADLSQIMDVCIHRDGATSTPS
ncbi:unnamed protein product, partial [Effrenium voratum]